MADWKEDIQLKADLEKYVCQGMTRKEILDFMQRDFSSYQWSIRTLLERDILWGYLTGLELALALDCSCLRLQGIKTDFALEKPSQLIDWFNFVQ